uniref:Uncharacterized protein n=1 Tax=Helicotheca tamesis TaxID=374047 RepID=A0A7S2N2D9_9STRA|eukprot:CAMPEP_0185723590 /NCGR_PEP_ID=MMETSP1171-20130828/388_1 /TAXON_ID=374046 /ORGANISM="Helicotheca tamensis, Strain CCMP826" /LENGTH=261 /DNA_ID=CAMNT_0028391321 /DNA_START=56 /DNA_END=841 /DNA_ORIENTATION=+
MTAVNCTTASLLLLLSCFTYAYSFTSITSRVSTSTKLFSAPLSNDEIEIKGRRNFIAAAAAAVAVVGSNPGISLADTIGKETEAPTLSTGESVMICKKRGPLGACLETVVRTEDNDNDKASKYFIDPKVYVKSREDALKAAEEESEGSELIRKLRQQTEANKERNELIVRQKTLENDQGASFGPFDRQVVILNEDGRTYTLLQNPQAMRLKKAGYIVDRRFVKQPSKEVIEEALNPSAEEEGGGGIGGFLGGLFGGGGGGE